MYTVPEPSLASMFKLSFFPKGVDHRGLRRAGQAGGREEDLPALQLRVEWSQGSSKCSSSPYKIFHVFDEMDQRVNKL